MTEPALIRQNTALTEDETYMARCLALAALGEGFTAPNPMVGAVLVADKRVIGEGYHELFGSAHAEVNCIRSVKPADESLIEKATLYVSLEPCAHHGKTPPCADLIISRKIPKVVLGCLDPNPLVQGRGVNMLRAAGVSITLGVLENECKAVNRRFFTYHRYRRPYIILKWAQSFDRFLAGTGQKPTKISNPYTDRIVHKWRSREAAVLVGSGTAFSDNPQLTVRNWKGPQPLRIVLDRNLGLPGNLHLFDRQIRTIVFNNLKEEENINLHFVKLDPAEMPLAGVLAALYGLHINSLLVEGGAKLLNEFISEGLWDETRIITNEEMQIKEGLSAPVLAGFLPVKKQQYFSDSIRYFSNAAFPI